LTEQVLYHKCGAAVIQDDDGTFRAHTGDTARSTILVCPVCGGMLRDRDLYHTKADIMREKLHDIGWYPDLDSLSLIEAPEKRAAIISSLKKVLDDMGNADLLAVYVVVMALRGEGEL